MIDVVMICTHLKKYEAAYRRIEFFTKFLIDHQINVKCIGFRLLTRRGFLHPDVNYVYAPILISTGSVLVTILNILLSMAIVPYLILLRPKVIMISVPDFTPLIPAYIGARLIRAKFIVDIRDPYEEIALYFFCHTKLERTLMRIIKKFNYNFYARSDVILTVTASLRNLLKEKIRREAIVVPNGADLSIFKSLDKDLARKWLNFKENTLILACVGLLDAYYDIFHLLDSIKVVRGVGCNNFDVKVVLAGRANELTAYMLKSPIFKDFVIYLGMLDVEGVRLLLSAADVGVISRVGDPIFDYAIPAKFYEYVACGLPLLIVARKESELAKLVIQYELGFVCEPNDISCVREAIIKIMRCPELLQKCRANVLNLRYKFNREVGANILLKIVKMLMKFRIASIM